MHEQTTITRLWEAVMLKYACNACDPCEDRMRGRQPCYQSAAIAGNAAMHGRLLWQQR